MTTLTKAIAILGLLGAALALGGCAGSQKTTGYLSDYDNLEQQGDRLFYLDDDALAGFDSLIIDPFEIETYDGASADKARAEGKLTDREIDQVLTYARSALVRELNNIGVRVVSRPGPTTARFRMAMTDLKKATPAMNILPQTKLTGLGAGQIAIEAELQHSQTGEQVAAAVQSAKGEFLWVTEGLGEMGDARRAIDEWAKMFARTLSASWGRG